MYSGRRTISLVSRKGLSSIHTFSRKVNSERFGIKPNGVERPPRSNNRLIAFYRSISSLQTPSDRSSRMPTLLTLVLFAQLIAPSVSAKYPHARVPAVHRDDILVGGATEVGCVWATRTPLTSFTAASCGRILLLCMASLIAEAASDVYAVRHRTFFAIMLLRDFGKQQEQCLFIVGITALLNILWPCF
jgi:hypothetical protein